MYHSKFVADTAIATPDDVRLALTDPVRGSAFLGLLVLLVGLPLLAVRLFAWAVARDIRRIGIVAATAGAAARRR